MAWLVAGPSGGGQNRRPAKARVERQFRGTTARFRAAVFELRFDYGRAIASTFFQRGKELVILLCGGDKRTQDADIAYAKRLKAEIEKRDGDKTV